MELKQGQPIEKIDDAVNYSPAKKSRLPFIIIITLIIVIILGTSFYLGLNKVKQDSEPAAQTQAKPTVSISPTPIPDSTADWTTYNIAQDPPLGYISYTIKVPASWKQIEHSSNFQDTETFQDDLTNNIYKLIIHQEKNINDQTGEPYASLREATGLPYEVTTLTVDKQQAARVLPRAGSESYYKVIFFSKDNELIFSIELDTPLDGSKIKEGEVLFTQILSTFQFINEDTIEDVLTKTVGITLNSPPPIDYAPIPQGTRLLDLKVKGNDIVINLSKEILANGTGVELENSLHLISVQIGNLDIDELKNKGFKFLIEGEPLENYRN